MTASAAGRRLELLKRLEHTEDRVRGGMAIGAARGLVGDAWRDYLTALTALADSVQAARTEDGQRDAAAALTAGGPVTDPGTGLRD